MSPIPVSSRIRQIITQRLSEEPSPQSAPFTSGGGCEVSELEDCRVLREEFCLSPADCDQTLVKMSLTDKLDQMLRLHSSVDSDQNSSSGTLHLQSPERTYWQKLQLYQEAQQRQAHLVQKLQAKVLQYKKRCGDLEVQVLEKTSESEKIRLLLQSRLDSAQRQQRTEDELSLLIQRKANQLDEEHNKCASLSQVNSVLRDQLEQAGTVNQDLSESLRKARADLMLCEMQMRKEKESSASHLSREQARVRALWRQAASLRSTFTQLRTFTDRTLSEMRGECVGVSRELHGVCLNLEASFVKESTPCGEESEPELQLRRKLKDAMQLQGRWDAEKVELSSRMLELNDRIKHLQTQSSVKDTSLDTMQTSLDRMETRRAEDKAEMEALQTENQALQKVIRHIHQIVLRENDNGSLDSPSSVLTHGSPLRNPTLIAVQNTVSTQQEQIQDLHGCLDDTLEQVSTLRVRLEENDLEKKELEKKIQEAQKESEEAQMALEESLRECKQYQTSLDLISCEKSKLEDLVSGLQQEVDRLRGSSHELQRQKDVQRQHREDLQLQLTRQCTEAQRSERSLEELESKHSDMRKELVMVKEALSQMTLQKELLEDDKTSLSLALSKMESQCTAQELSLAKMQSQDAALKDSLSKMATLSEGLAKDKVELNRVLLQKEREKAELSERRRESEMERSATREEAVRLQQDVMDLLAEKQAQEQSLSHMQRLLQELEAERRLLHTENTQATEQLSQVNKQMQRVSEELCACRRELGTQSAALKRVSSERDRLARDRAALETKLCSADRKLSDSTEDLETLRLKKESLETSLFESQELVSSLEAECSRMDGERRSLLAANEALTRE
uniref:Rootletin-like coiled-coil domain-containing protein n=1 Tax=Knipowitschia caucasica TaxID=637954 RepID=A0AAV2KTB0_KNICA